MQKILTNIKNHFNNSDDYVGEKSYEFYIVIDEKPYSIIIKDSDFVNYNNYKLDDELQLLYIIVSKYPNILKHLGNNIEEYVDFNIAYDRGWID